MSFILDALKKSEERRRLEGESRPVPHRIFDLTWSGTHRWPIGVFLTVLLVALACGWWLRGVSLLPATMDKTTDSAVTVSSGQISPPGSSPPVVALESPGQPLPTRQIGPAPFAPVPAVPVGEAVQPAADISRPVAGKAAVPGLRAVVNSAAPATQTARQRQSPGQVPADRRERIARLKMSVHFYAEDPAQRLVRIDNQFLREGQALADGLMIAEITPGGVIFSAAGERFEVPRLGAQP